MNRLLSFVVLIFTLSCQTSSQQWDQKVLSTMPNGSASKFVISINDVNVYANEYTKGEFFEANFKSYLKVFTIMGPKEKRRIGFDTLIQSPNIYSEVSLRNETSLEKEFPFEINYQICSDGLDACDYKKLIIPNK